jgi:hypothetical protein
VAVSRLIRRVVYFEETGRTEGIDYLRNNGILVRKAGV